MRRSPIYIATIVAMSGNALAQERPAQERPAQEGWRVTVGAGALYAPAYEGDDAYRLSVLPNVQIAYGERFFASVQGGIGYRWVNEPSLRAGPIAKVKFARAEDGDQPLAISGEKSNDLLGLGDVDASAELGGFIEYDVGALTLSLEARQAISGHDGFVADLGARWSGRAQMLGHAVIWSIGPRLRFVDQAYNTAYFGVTPTQAFASGLHVFQASGGLYSYGLSTNLIVPLTRNGAWSAVLVGGYDQLEGGAAASPLVQQRGDESQTSIGFFVARQF